MNRCHPFFSFTFRSWSIIMGMLAANVLFAQGTVSNQEDSGLPLRETSLTQKAPDGYVSIRTVEVSKPLDPQKAYEVGFWIIGKQREDQEYTYPIAVFPSNSGKKVSHHIFDLVESNQPLPALQVKPPPNFSYRGHFTFTVRPDKKYNFVTIALKQNGQPSILNFEEDITIAGTYVKPLPELMDQTGSPSQTKPQNMPLQEVGVPQVLAKRQLLDSKKRYTISEHAIQIGLYDPRNVDSDIVTIYLNDEIVVHRLPLKKKKKFYEVELRPGRNIITLYAENLGEVAPNTAAILIKGTSEEFMAILESDLGQSQFFTLFYEPN